MASRLALAVLLVAFSAMAAAAYAGDISVVAAVAVEPDGHGLVADALDFDEEMMMDSETARRQLRGRRGYISYGGIDRNNVPCNHRGRSYYNCHGHERANPYHRGCTRATRCSRNNH